MNGDFGYDAGVNIANITLLGAQGQPRSVSFNGNDLTKTYNSTTNVVNIQVDIPLTGSATVHFDRVTPYTGQAVKKISSANAWTMFRSVLLGSLLL